MSDPRIGKFFAVDPLESQYPYYSPYAFSGNSVVGWIEFEGLETELPEYLWAHSDGYKDLGNYYGRPNERIQVVEGWWIQTYVDQDGMDQYRVYDPSQGEWRRWVPAAPNSTYDDLSAMGMHVVNAFANNSEIEIKYTAQVGYGDAAYNRILGFELNRGIKKTATFTVLELNGWEAINAWYQGDGYAGINKDAVHVFDGMDVSFEYKKSKGIHSGSGKLGVKLDEGVLDLSMGGTGGYSALGLDFSSNILFDTQKLEFTGGDWDAKATFELMNFSNESTVKYKNGMELFHNINGTFKLSLKGLYKDLNKPVENKNNDNGSYFIDDNP